MKLLLSCLVCLLTAGVAEARIEVQGHRGARGHLPENTIPAMEYAISVGVDTVEMDLAVTKDGKLVLSHDPHINPEICLDPQGKKIEGKGPLIHSLTLAEVKKYDCGTLKNPNYPQQHPLPGTRIPSLDEVLALAKKHKKLGFNIETKIRSDQPENTTTPEEFAKLVVAAIKKHGLLKRAVIQSFDYRTLEAAKKIDRKVIISPLTETEGEDMVATVKKLKAEIMSPRYTLIDAAKVDALKKVGARVIPWTPNDKESWQKMVDFKVDGIISDYPEELIFFLKGQKAR